MKKIIAGVLAVTLFSCSTQQIEEKPVVEATQSCLGSTVLPEGLEGKFDSVEDQALLTEALGSPNKGKLCQGQVYQSKATTQVTFYRAWNSTNPNSKLGKWWAFEKPSGNVAQYRSDYEICYQWSPLDKLVSCSLKPGAKVVVGTGQSAECSTYLTYPVSATQQVYINDAFESLIDCSVLNGKFSWE